ncbi:MAG: hypothetical protein RIQ89_1158 [Bacteroidota bacterium]|jgi:hypothetical protein
MAIVPCYGVLKKTTASSNFYASLTAKKSEALRPHFFGTRERSRTFTLLPISDFESDASTNSATRAYFYLGLQKYNSIPLVQVVLLVSPILNSVR